MSRAFAPNIITSDKAAGGATIERSISLNDGSVVRFHRTGNVGVDGNRRVHTVSMWFKRTHEGVERHFFSARNASSTPYNEQKFEYEAKFGCNFVSQPPFKLTDAYNELRRLDGFSSMYLPGVYYDGTLSQIMNGATVQEWKSITKILNNQKEIERSHKIDWRGSNALDIDQNNEIRFVIIADVLNAAKLKESLIELGWLVRSSYTHPMFYTNVTLLERRK